MRAVSLGSFKRLPMPRVLARPDGMTSLRKGIWEHNIWASPEAARPCEDICLPIVPITRGAASPSSELAEPPLIPQWLAMKSTTPPTLDPSNELKIEPPGCAPPPPDNPPTRLPIESVQLPWCCLTMLKTSLAPIGDDV